MRRTLVAALAFAALAACTSSGTPTSPVSSSQSSGSAAAPASVSGAEQNRLAALALIHHLLTVLPLPAGSVRYIGTPPATLAHPLMGTPATSNFVDTTVFWRVPLPLGGVQAWLQAHKPNGFALGGTGTQNGPGNTVLALGIELSAPTDPHAPRNQPGNLTVSAAPLPGSTGTLWRLDGGDIWYDPTPQRDAVAGARIRVTVAGGCPASRGDAVDVTNVFPERSQMLLPSGTPSAALVCHYQGANPPPVDQPTSHRLLSAAQARALASQVRKLNVGSFGDGPPHSCPMSDGQVTVLVFAFPGADADLWWWTTGCQTVDNGSIVAQLFGGGDAMPTLELP